MHASKLKPTHHVHLPYKKTMVNQTLPRVLLCKGKLKPLLYAPKLHAKAYGSQENFKMNLTMQELMQR